MKKSFYLLMGLLILTLGSCKGQPVKGKGEATSPAANKNQEDSGNPSMASNQGALHIGKADFLKLIMDFEKNPDTWTYKGEIPCIVDFYADWCAPCRITSPILEEMAREYSGKIIVYKVDIEKDRELAAIFGVQSIPTFLFCPMEGNPTISSGIANTPDATRDMFRDQIEQILLKKGSSTNL